MTGTELRAFLDKHAIPHRWFADRCGVHETTVYRWCESPEVRQIVAFVAELFEALPPERQRAVLQW